MTDSVTTSSRRANYDVVIVGAGFAGMYMLHRMRELGLSTRVFERGGGVGGTWYWNRYPGARCDVESYDYSYSFSDSLQQEWSWNERYAKQPEILRYLNHVADRFDLRRDIELNCDVVSLTFDESTLKWNLRTGDGREVSARFCIMATGPLSRIKLPDIPGFDTYAGEWHHTARWPAVGVDVVGKRVGVIGTGSTGVQIIPQLAKDAEHLYVFQRTPNFSVPAVNRRLEPEDIRQEKLHYPDRRLAARRSNAGVSMDPDSKNWAEFDEAERRRILERSWQQGGGPAVLRAFNDLMLDEHVNDGVADFIRSKIREAVDDPDTAEKLVPRDYPVGAKRICVDSGYFETYNRDNVTLVDVRANPIVEITPSGLRTSEATYEFDLLVLAIGFDALSGALLDLDIRGREGRRLADEWAEGPRTLLGLMIAGFPNLFTVIGPGSPSVLGSGVHFAEMHVDWITRCLADLTRRGADTIEPTREAQEAWVRHADELAQATLFTRANSWFMGANIPGKPRVFLPYVGGGPKYRALCEEIAANGYEGFVVSEQQPVGAGA